MKLIVELGFELEKEYTYYVEMLKNNGLENVFNCKTHDRYYTNKDLNNMTENEMKNNCIRIRQCNDERECKIQNNMIKDIENLNEKIRNSENISFGKRDKDSYLEFENYSKEIIEKLVKDKIKINELKEYEKNLEKLGYRKVFDTTKFDHHFAKEGMNTRIQLQETENIGLILFFDNSLYYEYDLDEQRKKLIDELNSYGFDFSYDKLCLDKLRTLYYGKRMYSKNQNE